jgi:DNA-binding transcriptional ArsR family regulator
METLTHAPVLARFGYAVSDPTRARILVALADTPAYPSDLADSLGVSRQSISNHLACLRGCGLVVAVPNGRRSRYELVDAWLGHAIGDLDQQELAQQLLAQAREQGIELVGPGGLSNRLTKNVLETALEAEMDANDGIPSVAAAYRVATC